MTGRWQCLSWAFTVFATVLLVCAFLSRAQITLDQPADAGATNVAKPVGGTAGKSDEPKVSLTLKDGSKIIGTPAFKALTVTTPYGKVETKVELLDSIQFTPDQEKVKVVIRNGDALTGSLGIREFEVNTLFGRVRVDRAVVTSLHVLAGGADLPAALVEGLVLCFPFDRDEHGKVTDTSGKNNHGIVNGAKWAQQGKRGGAYEFNGSGDNIQAPDSDSLKLTDSFSIAMWVYLTPDIPNYEPCLISKGSSSGFDIYSDYSGSRSRTIWFQVNGGSALNLATPANVIDAGQWTHVAVTFKYPGLGVIYINDEVAASESPNGPAKANSSPLCLGKYSTNNPKWLDGKIDQVIIYNRALSAKEVKKLYDSQK